MTEQINLVPKRRFKEFQNTHVWEQRKLVNITAFNPKAELPETFEYVDLESVVGTEMIAHREETKATAPSRAQRLAKQGDLFYQTVRPYQKNNYLFEKADNNYVFSTGYAQLRPFCNGYFLLSLVQTETFVKSVLDRCTGTSYPAINSNDLADMEVVVPANEAEQTHIGLFFKQLDNLITLQKRKLEKTKALKSAYLSEMFPAEGESKPKRRFAGFTHAWEQRTVSDLADRYDNLRVPITASVRVAGSTPYYGANGIQDYVEGFTHDGEFILVAEDGANDLQNYPIQYVNGKVWVNNHAHVLQAKSEIADNKFLMNAMRHMNIEPYLVGGGRAKLNADVMMKISFRVPELAEQKQIGSFFANLDQMITLHQRKLEKLQNIKNAYLNEMFV